MNQIPGPMEETIMQAALLTAINHFSILKAEPGELGTVKPIAKVKGRSNCTTDFAVYTGVINGCSELMEAVFGKLRKNASISVGMVTISRILALKWSKRFRYSFSNYS